MVRGLRLAASMSRYLIDRIPASPNIDVALETRILAIVGGENGLKRGARMPGQEPGLGY